MSKVLLATNIKLFPTGVGVHVFSTALAALLTYVQLESEYPIYVKCPDRSVPESFAGVSMELLLTVVDSSLGENVLTGMLDAAELLRQHARATSTKR
jgi:hypothetical protein